jgi:hypothetical protein
MTLALAINIILSAIVLTAIVGSLVWAVVTSRDGQATASTKIKSLHELSTDGGRGTLSRLRPHAEASGTTVGPPAPPGARR